MNYVDLRLSNAERVSHYIWDLKYQLKKFGGEPIDFTLEDTFRRVAGAVAQGNDQDAAAYYHMLSSHGFLPAGRIINGAGSGRDVTCLNCFMMGSIEDSLDGIYRANHEAALTMRQGGGIGNNFSTIRPKGAEVERLGTDASGPLSFMPVWDAMCRSVMSAGTRRGAMMGVLACLEGSTKIHTVNGNIPIQDLVGTRPYLFAYDRKGKRIRVVQADKVFVSGRKRSTIRLRFDTRGDLVCTPDHLIMLKNGSYKPAGDLKVGDRLMAIEHGARGYYELPDSKNRVAETVAATGVKHRPVYHIVAEDVLLQKPDGYKVQIHHKDENRLNSDPLNLEALSVSEHAKTHYQLETSSHRKNLIQLAEYRKGQKWSDVYGEEWAEKRRKTQSESIKRAWAEGKMVKRGKNHRIIAIEDAGVCDKVYDISLPDWHNFAANEIFVHNCDHPDIEEFVEAKRVKGALTMFNLSVLVTDKFMEAVNLDQEWPLQFGGRVYKVIKAGYLWDKIMRATYDVAEPGVIFIDRMNQMNNLAYCEELIGTNPCSEQPLPAYGACLLGSVNLTTFVENPFRNKAHVNFERLKACTKVAVKFLDGVFDVSNYPLEQQRQEALDKRRMGLGVTGLGDMLAMLRLHYGTGEARDEARKVMKSVTYTAYEASIALAKKRGSFPAFWLEQFIESGFMRSHPNLQRVVKEEGCIRNSHLTSIAPTGTISLLAGNVSGGCEPIFETSYTRDVLMPNGDKDKMPVEDYAVGLYRSMYTDYLNPPCEPSEALPDYFVTADKLSTDQHIDMLAALQPYVDSSISKTVNCPVDISFDAFRSVYQRAYDSGCKSVSTFRPNDIRGSVLTTDASSVQDKLPETILTLTPRPEELSGSTYKLKVEDNSPAIYITINDETDANGRKRPYEVFINTKDTEHYAWIVALTLMISAVFRRGGDVAFVAHELKAMFDPRGSFWHKGRQIPSTVAAIGEIIERHMRKIGFVQDQTATAAAPAQPAQRSSKPCPRCASFMHRQGDCIECSNCGYTKCD